VIKSHVTDHFEWDDALPGFGIRVQNGGRASYVVQYKIGTKEKRRSLGKVDKVALSAAQKEAKSYFESVAKKIDPAVERAKAVAEAGKTFNPTIDGFLAKLKDERSDSYYAATKRYLEEHFKALHKLPLTSIDRAMAAKALSTIKEERGSIAMNRARSAGSAFFNWAIREGHVARRTRRRIRRYREAIHSDDATPGRNRRSSYVRVQSREAPTRNQGRSLQERQRQHHPVI
jgi:Arm DNA-binding domain